MSIGSNWTKLRIGMRMAIDDTGANIGATPRLYLGVMSAPVAGMTNGPLTSLTSHFWGIGTGNTTSWVRVAGPPAYYRPSFGYVRKLGPTNTYGGSVARGMIAVPGTYRNAYVLSFWKGTNGNADWTSNIVAPSDSPTVPDEDISTEQLKDAMCVDTGNATQASGMGSVANALTAMVTAGGGGYSNVNAGATTLNEAVNGGLDSICFAWNTSVDLHISDVYFLKFA